MSELNYERGARAGFLYLLFVFAAMGGMVLVHLIGGALATEADKPNWDTATPLDLPVNVTRIIQQDDTTFIYQAQGDEAYVLFSGGDQSKLVTNPKGLVGDSYQVRATSPMQDPPLQSVSLRVTRNTGMVEIYKLPVRDKWEYNGCGGI